MLGDIAVLILKTAFSIVLIALIARFLAQVARANTYNPLAQTVLKITNPFLLPLRRIIPGFGGLDVAALVCIWIGQYVLALLIFVVQGANPVPFLGPMAIWSLLAVAGLLMTVLQWSMIIVAIGSWISMGQQNPMLGFLQELVEPFVGPFRRLNLQVGMLDLSYIIAFLVLIILRDFVLSGMIVPMTSLYQAAGYFTGGIMPVIGL
ncbi:YggT family protein [Saccharospirillum mangrovi]|uniref:YggT family protein n=1 Tax=Saccharospirillum mangrovi TaxID=2161747 RepID=UPI000D3360FA|nr:YggT family protein [Saccharospirillum mangrovi]